MGLIYLDACLLIYVTECDPAWSVRVAAAIDGAKRIDGAKLVISPLVKLECLVGAIKRGDAVLQQSYAVAFSKFGTLAMPESVYFQAAALRARFGLKTPDALHLACAQHHRCEALWTNDNRLAKASRGLARKLSP